jgi:hypothetical protein
VSREVLGSPNSKTDAGVIEIMFSPIFYWFWNWYLRNLADAGILHLHYPRDWVQFHDARKEKYLKHKRYSVEERSFLRWMIAKKTKKI